MLDLNIGKDFSLDPAGRYSSDGEGNAEDFREKCLLPMVNKLGKGEQINIILDDGVEGYGSSFLVEGFAGIVKYGYLKGDELLSKLRFSYTDVDFEFYENKITQYIQEAQFNSRENESKK